MPFTPGAHAGILHHYTKRLVAFEHTAAPKSATSFVLFIGGMGDKLLTVRYPSVLAAHAALPASWAVAEVTLSSSGPGWLTSDLQSDADELAHAVAYFRALSAQRSGPAPAPCHIVLVGHSTGSQDAATYLIGPWKSPQIPDAVLARPRVDGVVLQAGISDREGLALTMDPAALAKATATAREMVAAGDGAQHMSWRVTGTGEGAAQAFATRYLSTTAEDGDDDLFSVSADDARVERVFGAGGIAARRTPLLVLIGAVDEHMLPDTDREGLVRRWEGFVRRGGGEWDPDSGVVPGATHNLNGASESAVLDLCGRILRFVARVGSAAGEGGKL